MAFSANARTGLRKIISGSVCIICFELIIKEVDMVTSDFKLIDLQGI